MYNREKVLKDFLSILETSNEEQIQEIEYSIVTCDAIENKKELLNTIKVEKEYRKFKELYHKIKTK